MRFLWRAYFQYGSGKKARQIIGAPHKILIRLNPELHNTLTTHAKKSNRSITEEVQHLLEESLREAS